MSLNKNSFSFGSGITSMTGFGRCEENYPGLRVTVEIRTVNNRFCDIGLKIPRDLNPMESEIRERIRSRINRGRVNLLINIAYDTTDDFVINIDSTTAQVCFQELQNLNRELGNSGSVTLSELLHFSEHFTRTPDRIFTDELRQQVLESLDVALNDLAKMRRGEGLTLAEDLLLRIEEIDKSRVKIASLAADQPKLQMERLQERLEQLVNAGTLDPGRLEQEMAILADKLDISEECVRLESHCKWFIKALAGDEPAGKRLGFLVQELNREANTIGSKSASVDISHFAISLKEEIERIREQIQNIE